MAYEFGFDVVRVEVEELEVGPDEPREFIIEALSGEVAAHINADVQGLVQLLDEVNREQREPGFRPGSAWEPQLPQMRGFFFHPRIVMSAVQAIAPHRDDDGEEIDYWEFVFDDDDGSQVVLRLSENATQQLARRVEDLVGAMLP
ncbi:MAG: hypothetical protein U0531_12485 [Dehalococcoidia bacterium]